MNSLLDRFRRKSVEVVKSESPAPKRKRIIPPHIVACKICEGKGIKGGDVCPQCKGSGRVIVSCEVTTYISAYVPEENQTEETK